MDTLGFLPLFPPERCSLKLENLGMCGFDFSFGFWKNPCNPFLFEEWQAETVRHLQREGEGEGEGK